MPYINRNNFIRWAGNFNTGDEPVNETCDIVVSNIQISNNGASEGITIYGATYDITAEPSQLIWEYSLDQITWAPVFNLTNTGTHEFTYDLGSTGGTAEEHYLRLTPICDNELNGTAATGFFSLNCLNATDVVFDRNETTNQLHISGLIPVGGVAVTLKLRRTVNGVANVLETRVITGSSFAESFETTEPGGYGTGVFSIEYFVGCSNGGISPKKVTAPITIYEISACAAPFNVQLAFTQDGVAVTATWEVADADYMDEVTLYDADTQVPLFAGNVAGGINTATFGIDLNPSTTRFYATVQHQCETPSNIALSGVIVRSDTYLLHPRISADGTTAYVDCTRYGSPANAPFTTQITMTITETTGGGGSIQTINGVSNYLLKDSATAVIYSNSAADIQTAIITAVTPQTQGTKSYNVDNG